MYDAEIEGENWTFGTSGFLYQSNKLMYDRRTNTLWHSLTGEPVIGPLAEPGRKLKQLPVDVMRWSDWLEAYPDSTVLSLDTGFIRSYLAPKHPGSAYFSYRNNPNRLFPTFVTDDRLPDKADVLGLEFDGAAKAYPIELLERELVVNDILGGQEVAVVGRATAGAARAYERMGLTFTPGKAAGEIVDNNGQAWTITDEALVSADGSRSLSRLPSRELFWFGWSAFFPLTEVYAGR